MFKKGNVYEVLTWEELLEKADSSLSKDDVVHSLLFEECDYSFVTTMRFLCRYKFECDSDCDYIERQGYRIYPTFCKELPNINHPHHYNTGDHETIDVIESMGWGTGFNLGNALKYIMRCEHKNNKAEDLKKAIWYLQRELKGENMNHVK